MQYKSILQAALDKTSSTPPNSEQVVAILLEKEKQQKQKNICSLADLVGKWNLRFITGTRKTRQRAGVVLGAGRYIPRFIEIQIQYTADDLALDTGRVINSVKLSFLQISLTGPIKFMPQQRILAFDFTYLKLSVGRFNLYQGYVKNGLQRNSDFYQQKLKNQAFFKYFLIEDNFIAARGKGGGLALWEREEIKL